MNEPSHADKTGGASVWYGWLAPADGVVTFATTGSGFDTLLAVYTGASVDQLTPVTSDDDSGGAFASRVTCNVIQGTEYILAVDGLGARTGRIFLAWDLDTLSPSAPVITSSPASRTVPAGSPVALQVTVQSATAVAYQWFKDDDKLDGETGATLTIPAFTVDDIGAYVVRVINASEFPAFSVPALPCSGIARDSRTSTSALAVIAG